MNADFSKSAPPSQVDVSVVVPVMNEQDAIEELVQRIASALKDQVAAFEILIVDDGSSDSTIEFALRCKEKTPQLRVLELSRNYGQTAALAAGIDHARGEVIVTMDGDLQHHPEAIHQFLEKLNEGFDVVSGWRQVRTDSYLLRRVPSLLANALMRALSGVPVRDFGSTYKAYRAEVLKQVEMFGELHRFLPVLAHQVGARIVEIPIAVHPRTQGVSKYGLSRTLGVFQDVLFLSFYTNYLTKPLRVFGKLAFFFFSAGFSICAIMLLAWSLGKIYSLAGHSSMLLFAVFLMIIGIQFFVAGLHAEILSRVYFRTSNSQIYRLRREH